MTGTTQSRVRLESTMLATAGYDEHRCELQLDFRDGARYQYSAVPPHLFHDLLAAPSKESFFNRHIRGRSIMLNLRSKTKWHWALARL